MEPRKKRKVEPGPAAPPASAFALRRRLLEQKEAAARAAQVDAVETTATLQADDVDAVQTRQDKMPPVDSPPSSRTRRGKPTQDNTPKNNTPHSLETKVDQVLETPPVHTKSNVPPVPSATRQDAPVTLRSSFQPNKQNFQQKANGHMALKLEEDERLVILGSYGLTVKQGEVTLAGATLRASEKTHWVHAPRCHALPALRCTDDAFILLQPHPAAPALHDLEKLSPVFSRLWNEPQPDATGSDTATFQILFTSEDGPGTSRNLSSLPEWNKMMAELTTAKKAALHSGQPVLFVCGPKSSGKSTFARLLTNRLLTAETPDAIKRSRKWALPSVAVLDIDPGQPEYGTPGSLSLVHVHEPNLTPTFCHPHVRDASDGRSSGNRLLRAHELASVSPATDPEHYIECVMDLYSLYHRDLRNRCPLVINTPGWIQGTGLEILRVLAKKVQPSRVIYMSQEGPEDTVLGLRSAYQNVPLVELPSQPGDLRVKTAAHLRTMQTMSYFHLDLDGGATLSSQSTRPNMPKRESYLSWQAMPLTAVRPWVVPYTGPAAGILGIMCYDSQPPSNLVTNAINGTIVSIVAIENAAAFRTGQQGDASENGVASMDIDADDDAAVPAPLSSHRLPPLVRSPEGLPYILNANETKLDPRHSRKLGVALVRGIDDVNKELHLLSPLPADAAIDEVIRQDGMGVVLVSGKFDPPTWAYTEEMHLQATKAGKWADGKGSADTIDEDTDSEDGGDGDGTNDHGLSEAVSSTSDVPWVQTLQGRQTRDVGSQVWRVRRDLGRTSNGAGGGD